jgi:hypothetical protein
VGEGRHAPEHEVLQADVVQVGARAWGEHRSERVHRLITLTAHRIKGLL